MTRVRESEPGVPRLEQAKRKGAAQRPGYANLGHRGSKKEDQALPSKAKAEPLRSATLLLRFLAATLTLMSNEPGSSRHSSVATRHFSVGLIGGGNISETHARAARAIPGVAIAAVYGTNAAKVSRLAHDYGGTPYKNLDAFLTHRPMDLVMIGSPSGLHAEHGIAAARHGLHVLTEKPIDISTSRADALISAAAQANVKLGVLFQDRTKPHLRQLKSWLEQGQLGRPLFADARVKWYRPPEYYANSRWRGTFALDGGGALINQGIHTVDLLLWLLGDVTRVQACTATQLHKIEAEDTAVALLEFANGALGTFHATTAAYPGYPRRVEITGTQGTVILEHDRIVSADLRDSSAAAAVSADLARLAGAAADQNQSATSAAVSDFRGHQLLLEDFLQAIEENGAPLCDGREARRSLALVEQIYNSAQVKP
jgi:UDP-N-acetyl-2-amino-2-deoxyglucuronate dehydrogenase